MQGMEAAPEGVQRVRGRWIIYDNCVIGEDVPTTWPGCYQSFTQMAKAQFIPFLNVRQESEVDSSVTNIEAKTKLDWPFWMESVGIKFKYPNPYNSQIVVSADAQAHIFEDVLPDHCMFEFIINQDTHLRQKPKMLPPGYGGNGMASYINWSNNSYSSVYNSGVPVLGNRLKLTRKGKYLKIPDNTPIGGKLWISEYGKKLLDRMVLPLPLDFKEGDDAEGEPTTPNRVSIEVSLFGDRAVQQRGDYFAS